MNETKEVILGFLDDQGMDGRAQANQIKRLMQEFYIGDDPEGAYWHEQAMPDGQRRLGIIVECDNKHGEEYAQEAQKYFKCVMNHVLEGTPLCGLVAIKEVARILERKAL